jgi:hypothetical protein
MTSKKEFHLFKEIIERSQADTWEEAKLEWKLDHINFASDEDVVLGTYRCLCGHSPLKELCYIFNASSAITAMVGNCCVKKFMGEIESDKVFSAVKNKRVNKATIEHAFARGIISQHEHDYCLTKFKKRKRGYVFELYQYKILRKILPRKTKEISKEERQMIAWMDAEALWEREHGPI